MEPLAVAGCRGGVGDGVAQVRNELTRLVLREQATALTGLLIRTAPP